MTDNRWLLPEGIQEILPQEAARLELLRRRLLDQYASWGYELVIPPLIEYLESLLIGAGSDLELQTFKITDQLNGRMMGIRADMTPQVARIDAHQLRRDEPTRLCYIGTVLHTRPDGFAGSRSPVQTGAELYGHEGPASDIEIISLMIETLRAAGLQELYIDIGHVGIYREVANAAGFDKAQTDTVFDLLQRKALVEIREYLTANKVNANAQAMLLALVELNGDISVLNKARTQLKAAGKKVVEALDYLTQVAEGVQQRAPDLNLHFDLAELRGYHYHQTGVVFAAYAPGEGQEVARGGRYDGIGAVFGRPRAATGFSTDLNALMRLTTHDIKNIAAIYAPVVSAQDEAALWQAITTLRAQGECVIQALPETDTKKIVNPAALSCNRQLLKTAQGWQVKPL
ncbi:MAG: ATP phosphoribosyltransferase regulatory subunit [Gammaproteobacteria bacterium]|nr:ATP phosphoribosyltransferase regulatory subunit [Gammaproteobacteria bacterium]